MSKVGLRAPLVVSLWAVVTGLAVAVSCRHNGPSPANPLAASDAGPPTAPKSRDRECLGIDILQCLPRNRHGDGKVRLCAGAERQHGGRAFCISEIVDEDLSAALLLRSRGNVRRA